MRAFPNSRCTSCIPLLLSFALLFCCCGKKEPERVEEQGPQSSHGGILESVQKTVDQANERSRDIEETSESFEQK